jgi:hypothetical protein
VAADVSQDSRPDDFVVIDVFVVILESTHFNSPDRRGVVLERASAFTQEARLHDRVELIYQAVDNEVAPENAAALHNDLFALLFFSA